MIQPSKITIKTLKLTITLTWKVQVVWHYQSSVDHKMHSQKCLSVEAHTAGRALHDTG